MSYKKKLMLILTIWSIVIIFFYILHKSFLIINSDLKISLNNNLLKIKKVEKIETTINEEFNKNNFEKKLIDYSLSNSIKINNLSSNINNNIINYEINYESSYDNSKKILSYILKNKLFIKKIEMINLKKDNIVATKIYFTKND